MPNFLKDIAGSIMKQRQPDEDSSGLNQNDDLGAEQQPDQGNYALEDCAHDIIAAVKANDPYMLADALREAFNKLQEQGPQEGEPGENQAD